MPRFFVACSQIKSGKIQITGQDAHHITSVLRLKPGDEVTVSDGAAKDYECILETVSAVTVWASIQKEKGCSSEPSLKVSLFQGLPKGAKMELVIQKTVELGVYEIIPVISENAVVKTVSHAKEERWQKIAEAAAKQSGRGIIPRVWPSMSLAQAVSMSTSLDISLVAHEKEERLYLKEALRQTQYRSLGIFIGPEGGFSENEMTMFVSQKIYPFSLGRRVLRTETAGFAALLLSLYERNEL